MNDTKSILRDIQRSQETLRQQMVDISTYSFTRPQVRDPFDKWRFLFHSRFETLQPTSSKLGSDLPVARPASPSASLLPAPVEERSQLRIGRRSALKHASAYVAVSYCWGRSSEWLNQDGNTLSNFQILCEDGLERQSAAPSDVLLRSIAFAEAHGTNAIWIDQECINQSDAVEKEDSIQEMDMVYQESDHPIAVLDFAFETQAELDAFSSVCDTLWFQFDPSQIEDLGEVLFDLSKDKWFERAWTLQESVSAGLSMTLLLSCSGLQKSPHFGSTPDEVEISLWDFQQAMVNVRCYIEDGLSAAVWPDPTHAIDASNSADLLWNYMPTIPPDWTPETLHKRDSSHRQCCNAAQALTFLNGRFNSVFSDRLAILANLCNYKSRIPSKVLDLPNSSFTVCAHTLAILNGDMSLLAGYVDKGEETPVSEDLRYPYVLHHFRAGNARTSGLIYVNDDNDLHSNVYGFSWGPRPSACLKDISYLEEDGKMFRMKPATLSVYGLRVCGVLWKVDCKVPVPRTQSLFASRWQEELIHLSHDDDESRASDQPRQQSLIREFFWSLLHELVSSESVDLAKTLWNFVQPAGIDPAHNVETNSAPLPYSFNEAFGQSHIDQDKGHEILSRLKGPDLWFHHKNSAADRPLLERLVIEQVCVDGALLCATSVDPFRCTQSSPLPPRHAWFEACKFGDKLFTPATDLGDEIPRSRYRNQAMSWRVLETGRYGDDGCVILHCLGRRRGISRIEGLIHQDVVLD